MTVARPITPKKMIRAKDTLRSMNVGESAKFAHRTYNYGSFKNAASQLRNEGLAFEVSKKDYPDAFVITRLK